LSGRGGALVSVQLAPSSTLIHAFPFKVVAHRVPGVPPFGALCT
jgi:hypothetical protein